MQNVTGVLASMEGYAQSRNMIWIILIFVFFVIVLYVANQAKRKPGMVVSARLVGSPPRPREVSSSGNRVFYEQVHGIKFKNTDGTSRQEIIKDCREGEELALVPEPDNPFDPGAVKVCRKNGEQLGYWPADGRMANDLALGWTYRVTIDEIYPFEENHRKHGVKLRVEVLTMSRTTEARKQKKTSAPHSSHTTPTAKG
jgi:hypothetical protein